MLDFDDGIKYTRAMGHDILTTTQPLSRFDKGEGGRGRGGGRKYYISHDQEEARRMFYWWIVQRSNEHVPSPPLPFMIQAHF